MTVRIDEEKVFRIIEEKRPTTVVVSAPEGLLRQTMELMEKIKTKYGINCILSGDTCYGICDTVDEDVERLGADIALHIGHNAAVKTVGNFTYLIDAIDDIEFDQVVQKALVMLRGFKKIGLATFSQHLHQLRKVKQMFETAGYEIFIGKGNNLLLEGQIFGCDFSTTYNLKDQVDAFCVLGESEFHAIGLALATDRPTFILDPYLNHVLDVREVVEERRKRAILAVYKALDAKVFGVITGLKEGQMMIQRTKWIVNKLQFHGRKVIQLAMREIVPERLEPYSEVEAFIQTACPRISIDGFNFSKPVLSIPQADALIRLIEGRDIGNFLQRPKWIELTVGLIPGKSYVD